MDQIESPPEVVEAAQTVATAHGFARMVIEDGWDQEADDMIDGAIGELREQFPHLDDATLVLVCHYISSTCGTRATMHSDGCCGELELGGAAVGFSEMAARIGRPLL